MNAEEMAMEHSTGEKEMNIDRNKVRQAVAEYVYFLLDNELKVEADAAAFDSRRRKLHDAITEIMGFKPEDFKDTYIADGLKDKTVPVEDYIDFHTDRVISKVHNNRAAYNGIKIQWDYKERIPYIIERNKKRIDDRIKEVDKVMERAVNGLDDWNKDHPNDKYLYTWSVGINTHDWNGLRDAINSNWAKMEALAEMPREAYTKILVNEYLDKPLAAIESLIKELEGIAFRAERTKYYTYEKKGKVNE